jgi:hypothetical protein
VPSLWKKVETAEEKIPSKSTSWKHIPLSDSWEFFFFYYLILGSLVGLGGAWSGCLLVAS